MKIHLCTEKPCPLEEKEFKDVLDMMSEVYYAKEPITIQTATPMNGQDSKTQ